MANCQVLLLLMSACVSWACDTHATGKLFARQDAALGSIPSKRIYDYAASWNWANLDPDAFGVCQNGTQQSPIALSSQDGLATTHVPTFNYPAATAGKFKNWGFGPAFDVVYEADNITGNPSVSFDNETAYLVGWHIHTPADHVVDGYRPRAELHLVHQNAQGKERAVVGIFIEPQVSDTPFIDALPRPFVRFNPDDPDNFMECSVDLNGLIAAAGGFEEYWTYEGSLTSPPCSEGKRWWVSKEIMYVSHEQMRMILSASTYSAREVQAHWQHHINE